jgi:flagellar hook-associated protein 1 FlgK
LAAYEKALTVTQNNVENASTPGYVKQTATFQSLPFEAGSEAGGVIAGDVQSSRNEYAEQNVRTANSQFGFYEQQVESLTTLQNQFDVSGKSGVSAALSSFYTAASAWSNSPNDTTVRQNVITQAQTVATAFNTAQADLAQITSETDTQIGGLVNQINSYSRQISQFNSQLATGHQSDPSLDASVHSALENLSEIANTTVLKQKDGTYEVLLDGGQSALVAGANAYPLTVSQGVVTDSTGRDATPQITQGKLGAALDVRNRVLPSIGGDAKQPGSLNTLAKGFADRINELLTSGNSVNGSVSTATPPVITPPVAGVPLFTYDPTHVASTLAVSGSGTQLAAIQPAEITGTPVVGTIDTTTNNALNLKIDGTTYNLTLAGSATATLASVAADITSQLAAAGSTATARINSTGSLQIVSGTNSSTASVAVLAGTAETALGLTVGTGSSYSSNGISLKLASLSNSTASADQIGGQTFTQYFGSIAAGVGSELSNATANQTTHQDLLTQAQSLRQDASGIDLNEEATKVLEFQRAYQAASKLMSVVDQMVQTVINLIQPS